MNHTCIAYIKISYLERFTAIFEFRTYGKMFHNGEESHTWFIASDATSSPVLGID